jgi:hypothetical protein
LQSSKWHLILSVTHEPSCIRSWCLKFFFSCSVMGLEAFHISKRSSCSHWVHRR